MERFLTPLNTQSHTGFGHFVASNDFHRRTVFTRNFYSTRFTRRFYTIGFFTACQVSVVNVTGGRAD